MKLPVCARGEAMLLCAGLTHHVSRVFVRLFCWQSERRGTKIRYRSAEGSNADCVRFTERGHMLTTQEIMAIIPHRYPFLLIDRIVELEPGRRAVGEKLVTIGEPLFQGHFPDFPIMPCVLIVEALAQTACVAALSLPEYQGKIGLFAGIDNARFKRPVRPGDTLRLEIS